MAHPRMGGMRRHLGKKGGQTAKVKRAERERQAVQRSGRGAQNGGQGARIKQ